MKKLLTILIMCGLTLHLAGCSSSDTDEGGDEQVAAQDAGAKDEMADAAQDPAADGSNAAKDPTADNAGNPDDQKVAANDAKGGDDLDLDKPADGAADKSAQANSPDDPLADAANAAAADASQPAGDQANATDPNAKSPNAKDQSPAPSDQPAPGDQAANATPTPTDASAASTEPVPAPIIADAGAGADKPKAAASPLQKIKDTPFEKGGVLLNTVYLARPGDTTKSISEKVYGDASRAKDLKAANAILKSRNPKTGDKIYYNSPNRPDDAERMLTYYEDQNIAPQIYTAASGDDLKTVGKTLLGNKDSWKELWATNEVQTKGALDEGTQIRYWPDDAAAGAQTHMAGNKKADKADKMADLPPVPPASDIAKNTPPPAMPPSPGTPSTTAPNADTMGSTAPPPPGGGPGSPPGGTTAGMAPPPPPPMPNEPPAPPVAMKAPKAPQAQEGLFGLSDDNLMILAAVGALFIGGALIMAIKKKKDAARFADGQTQI